jgi:hypothetical protein
MDVLARLTNEEQLITRGFEAAELRAHNKMHEFKSTVEAQFNRLQAEATAKTQETIAHLQALAKKYEVKIEDAGFDFETLVFHSKPKQ